MMYDLPAYVWALVLTTVIGILAATSLVLYLGAIAAGLSRRTGITVAATAYALLGGWLVASGLLAWAGAYVAESGRTGPWLALGFTSFFALVLFAARIPLLSRILAHPKTLALLTIPHTWRIGGITFLTVMALGHLPAVFALPAGLGDIAIGLAAPFIARRLARGNGRAGAVRFNLLGILDLIVAGTLGFLLFRVIEVTPSTAPLFVLPLALIPTVPVPLALALHIVS